MSIGKPILLCNNPPTPQTGARQGGVVVKCEGEEKPPQGRLEDDLMFELHSPGGETWRLYLSGRAEGFPPGTVVVNHALPLANGLVGKIRR
jgi:hypothetical protein